MGKIDMIIKWDQKECGLLRQTQVTWNWAKIRNKVVPPQLCLLVYNPNNYRYNPLINPSYSTYKPT